MSAAPSVDHCLADAMEPRPRTEPLRPVAVVWQDPRTMDIDRLTGLLRCFGDLLTQPLSARLDLANYAAKLLRHAEIACGVVGGEVVALLLLYANDEATGRAHVPMLSVLPMWRGRGIARVMLSRAGARARQRGMTSLELTVARDDAAARRLYSSAGFREGRAEGSRLWLTCPLSSACGSDTTPLEANSRLLTVLGGDLDVDLRIKRDDLYPLPGGGIKARKIRYILRDVIAGGHDVLVTNGGPQSNHARAAAVGCAELGIRCHLVIVLEPDTPYLDSGNILLMRLSGATIEFCHKEQLAERMDAAMAALTRQGHHPLYVWGGGHGLQGTLAFVEAAAEAQAQCGEWRPDFMIAASATGSTQAGFAIGYAGSSTRVIGISVARAAERGARIVRECVAGYYAQGLPTPAPQAAVHVDFRDEWTDGGYERTSPALLDIVRRAARAGVFVDPTYSGKALRGLVELVRRGDVPRGSRVLFWHTGGLMNLLASPLVGDAIQL